MCVDSGGNTQVCDGVACLHRSFLATRIVAEDTIHYFSYNCRRWNMRIPCKNSLQWNPCIFIKMTNMCFNYCFFFFVIKLFFFYNWYVQILMSAICVKTKIHIILSFFKNGRNPICIFYKVNITIILYIGPSDLEVDACWRMEKIIYKLLSYFLFFFY